jgi:hypothetical protein
MKLFLDVEWADVLASELVSMALVSLDGQHVFYAERDPLPQEPTPWVRTVVYPLLERGEAAMDDAAMTRRLRKFLAGIPALSICYDSGHDRGLCQYVVDGFEVAEPDGPMPPAITWVRLDGMHAKLERWWKSHPEQNPKRHHALVDAMALRGAALES